MSLERLIAREAPETIQYGIVQSIDQASRRVKVLGRSNIEIWASYVPSDFPDLAVGQSVAIAVSNLAAFLVRRLSSKLPEGSTILEL